MSGGLDADVLLWAVHDPQETLAVRCGNGFDAGLSPIKVLV
jgi:hypothetical protein